MLYANSLHNGCSGEAAACRLLSPRSCCKSKKKSEELKDVG